jgi:hypothetical protein
MYTLVVHVTVEAHAYALLLSHGVIDGERRRTLVRVV